MKNIMNTIDIAIKKKFIIDRKIYHPSIKWSNDVDLINSIIKEYFEKRIQY